MIRKSGYWFSEKIMRKQEPKAKQCFTLKSFRALAHDPERPVLGLDTRMDAGFFALAIAAKSRPVTVIGLDHRIGRFGGSGPRARAGQRHRTAGGRGHGESARSLPRHGYRSTNRLLRGEGLGRRRACWRCWRCRRRKPRRGEVRRAGRVRIGPDDTAIRGARGAGRNAAIIRSRCQRCC
jgi:hypothetical protein